MHAAKLVTDQFPEPEGDRGGTRFYIRVKPNSKTISLHQLWDGLILGSDQFQAVRNEATELRNRSGFKREDFVRQLAVKPFTDWALETYSVAAEQAYSKGGLKGSSDKNSGVVLPSGYSDNAKEAAERQIVLAGYRISDVMVDVF